MIGPGSGRHQTSRCREHASMSVDWLVFAVDDSPVPIDELRGAMAGVGWQFVAIRDYYEPNGFRVVAEGGFDDVDFLIGWPLADESSADHASTVATRDRQTLDQWLLDHERLGAASVRVLNYDAEEQADPEELAEIARQVSPEYAQAIRQARLLYEIEPRGQSEAFLDELARWICSRCGGAWTDNMDKEEIAERGGPVRKARNERDR
ncbi:MAG: hypothetical protein ACYC61_07125 [Isosphaeraceae bacterium]